MDFINFVGKNTAHFDDFLAKARELTNKIVFHYIDCQSSITTEVPSVHTPLEPQKKWLQFKGRAEGT